jgi:hypothetical protein
MQTTHDISATVKATQCAAILKALRIAPLSTFAAREDLGIASPAARVFTLRKAGHPVKTTMRTVFDAQGRPHTSAVYSLHEVRS